MKQRISVAQLLSLTPAQQERLREWYLGIKPRFGDRVAFRQIGGVQWVGDILVECNDTHCWASGWYSYHTQLPLDNILPLLSIGQCLELLCSKGVATIEARPAVGFSMHIKVPVDAWGKESIDALFAAVRGVL